MARGWESKSVEAQQAEANEKPGARRKKMSPAEAAMRRQEENLRLSRQRVLQQLQTVTNERQRATLEAALAELDEKLKRYSFQE